MKKQKTKKTNTPKIPIIDWLVVISLPIIAASTTILFHTNQVISLFLFFILPAVYLSIRKPQLIKKGLIMVAATIPFTFVIDYFAIRDGSWWVYTIFPFRLLNGIPIEDFIWSASWFYYIVIFYEYFIDQAYQKKDAPVNGRYKAMLTLWMSSFLVFMALYLTVERFLHVPYFYAAFAIILGVVPMVLVAVWRHSILIKYAKLFAYFFPVNFLHEISALSANQWIFPGKNFIGWVQIFSFRFPFEEFILWMMLGALYLVAWYEYFVDDTK